MQTISTGLCLTFLHSMCLFDSDHIRRSAPRPVARRHHQLVHEVDDRPGGLVKVKLGKHVTLEMCHVLNRFRFHDFNVYECDNVNYFEMRMMAMVNKMMAVVKSMVMMVT